MNLEKILHKQFGYSAFRPGQREIIEGVLSGRDVVGRLPTGSGKSLCYMLPGQVLPGMVIIVSPLLSLMEDQVQRVKMMGEKRVVALNSFRTFQEKRKIMEGLSQLKYLFVSPEMLQNKGLTDRLLEIPISLIVIDEAHCISKWGYDFRPDYLRLRDFIVKNQDAPIMALTATATQGVLSDIARNLEIKDPLYITESVNRENIVLFVEKVESEIEKIHRIEELIEKMPKPLLVYCTSRRKTEELYETFKEQFPLRTAYYHGGIDSESRVLLGEQFTNNQLDVMYCTSAFGMGIHHDNIRTILHYHPPLQFESFVQEMGRAGRDQKESYSILLVSKEDSEYGRFMVDREFATRNEIQEYVVRALSDEPIQESHRVLDYYLEQEETEHEKNIAIIVENIYNKIERRKEIRFQELAYMSQWVTSNKCRREGLLHYFEESLGVSQSPCCDVCGSAPQEYFVEPREASVKAIPQWEARLRKIFAIGED